MKRIYARIEHLIDSLDPAVRRRLAIKCLFWSFIFGNVNVLLYVFGVLDAENLIVVTLWLSWLAVTVTAADWVIGTDIRKEVEE